MRILLLCLLFSFTGLVHGKTLVIGDSVFALSGEIKRELERLSGLDIDSNATSGSKMLSWTGFTPPIPTQYARVNRSYDTVVMNGGGNDVLIGNSNRCGSPLSDYCKDLLLRVNQRVVTLMQDMVDDGVELIIYMGYYHLPPPRSRLDESTDFGTEIMKEACERIEANCIVVSPLDAFEGQSGLVGADGVHPTTKGSRLLAKLVWEKWSEAIFD